MKKVIALIVLVLSFVSCKELDTEYVVTYRVYYSNTPTTKSYTFKAAEGEGSAYVTSDRGSNHLHVNYTDGWLATGCSIEHTSAPIEIVSVTRK